MNIIVTLAVVVIAVGVVVQAVLLIPAVLQLILQLRKTLAAAEEFLKDMDKSLKPLIEDEIRPTFRSLNSAIMELEGVAKGAREGVEKVDDVLEAFREVGGTVRSINGILNTALKSPLIKAASYLTGIRVGIETLVNTLRQREQKEVQ